MPKPVFNKKRGIGGCYSLLGVVGVIVVLCVLATLVFVFPNDQRKGKIHKTYPKTSPLYSQCPFIYKTTVDGSDHGPSHYHGASGTMLGRFNEPGDFIKDYDDRGRPNPRIVSNKLCKQKHETKQHPRFRSLVWSMGQWVSHTISLSEEHSSRKIKIDIRGDEHFSQLYPNDDYMVFSSTEYVEYPEGYRQPTSIITHYVDGNTIYGSNSLRGSFLRKFKDGLMKSQYLDDYGEFPPYNLYHVENAGGQDKKNHFIVGDLRGNEQFPLMAMHTLWLREHNYQAKRLKEENPDWEDDCLFNAAKNIVVGLIQNVIFHEFVPALIGEELKPPSYNKTEDPRIYAAFSAAAYRLHSLVNEKLLLNDPWSGKKIAEDITLRDAFFNPALVKQYGIDPLILGLTMQRCESMDTQLVDSLRDFLFFKDGKPLDLCSANIVRGREFGLPDFATMRKILHMEEVHSWDDITDDHQLKQDLEHVYGHEGYKNLDLFIGLNAEKKTYGETFGATQKKIIKTQFERLRDSDKLYYEWNDYYSKKDLDYIKNRKFRDIILHNTYIEDSVLPHDVFLYEDPHKDYERDHHVSKDDDEDDNHDDYGKKPHGRYYKH